VKSQHQFSQVPRADIPRSSFNLSHGLKTTFDADYLVPVEVIDIIPGDTINLQMNFFARLATPIHPILDNMYLESFFFFVPYRLVWSNFEKFHGSQDDPGDSIDFTIPIIDGVVGQCGTGGMWDYFGLPIDQAANNFEVSALPFRAYSLIWNEWFRDENLQDSEIVNTGDGPDTLDNSNPAAGEQRSSLRKRGKRHDYFTSCLPWPQKSTNAVSLPLGTSAPVTGIGVKGLESGLVTAVKETGASSGVQYDGSWVSTTAATMYIEEDPSSAEYPNILADLTNATAATINDLRLAFQTQRLLERDARSGTRYVESLKAHWGVTSPDFRLQRPEFLGGGSSPVNITPVAQTSGQPTPVSDDALGRLAGFGTVSGKHSFTQSFVEHGVVIGLVNVRGDITYSQGIDRYWDKSTRYDFYYPVLSGIGEQSVLNKEIWADGSANDDLVFGYQERYAEYRYMQSKLTGLMRPDAASSLAPWHLSEDFATLPTLGDTFIQSNLGEPLDRAIAVSTEPHFIADFFFNIKAARPMPLYGVPGSIDHF